MLDPAHPDLLELALAQAINVHGDDGMIGGAGVPVEVGIADVAGVGAQGVSADAADTSPGLDALNLTDDHVGSTGRVAGNDDRAAGVAEAAERRRDGSRRANPQNRSAEPMRLSVNVESGSAPAAE